MDEEVRRVSFDFCFHGFFEGPVLAALRAFSDPALEHGDVLWLEGGLARLGGPFLEMQAKRQREA